MRALCLLLALPLLVLGQNYTPNTPQNPWGPYGEDCLVGRPWLYDTADSSKTKLFVIDLDKSPEERWHLVGTQMAPYISAALETVQSMLSLIPGLYDFLVNLSLGGVNNVPEPYRSEMTGMSRSSGISLGEIALMNFFYEIAKGCTSIVAQTPEGKIYHARNQDFGFLFIWNITLKTWQQTTALKDVMIAVDFVQNGQLLFKGTTFAGHMGILTGLRPHGFTLSTNARFGSTKHNMIDFFKNHVTGREFILYMDRDVLTQCDDYACAMNFLSTTPMLASGYFIVGGRNPGEGAVITRGPNGTDHIQTIDVNRPNGWYVLETNYDWDKNVIYLDDRRGPGNDCMQRLGQANVGHRGLYQVLSSKPNLNKATVYTSVMQVDEVKLTQFIRNCDDPCWFV